jgi:hypothetical protein
MSDEAEKALPCLSGCIPSLPLRVLYRKNRQLDFNFRGCCNQF